MNAFRNEIISSNVMDKIDHNPFSNPNKNYNILESAIISAKEKHLKPKKIRFNKYKHKKGKMDNSRHSKINKI